MRILAVVAWGVAALCACSSGAARAPSSDAAAEPPDAGRDGGTPARAEAGLDGARSDVAAGDDVLPADAAPSSDDSTGDGAALDANPTSADTASTHDALADVAAADAAVDAFVDAPAPSPYCREAIGPPPAALKLAAFYTKYLDGHGIPIVSSAKPADAALRRACAIVVKLVEARDDVRLAMIAHGHRVAVMAATEVTTDIPEHADLYQAFPGTDWNTRARGLGATLARPATSCAEENLLCFPTDPYRGENILVHEFSHGMDLLGIRFVDPGFVADRDAAYAAAMAAGKWANTYAASNVEEYWAEGVQDWFDANLESIPPNGIHNEINTRAELAGYDPALHALIARYFTAEPWSPGCP